uniref:RAS and EF-hand domain containing n=1 Tax=Nothobranchius furzeri TaxID=105023 RepID=A0A8C6MH09_NOTFU
MSAEETGRLRALFRAYDVDKSGRIDRNEFVAICAELQVSAAEADTIFKRLDADQDGTVTLKEFLCGFKDMDPAAGDASIAWGNFQRRLGELAKYIPRHEQAVTLYQNISLTEPRLIPQFEKVIINFTREIKQQNSEMENLALAIKRAQDQASMQLSEMEEEMDQRIESAERKAREQEKKQTESALNELRRSYETEVCELQCKIQRMQMIEEKYKTITVKDEGTALKKKINELTLENQRLKQELLKSQTNVACLQSDMDSLKTELTDQSINSERDEELMKHFSDERDILESQIEILKMANRKLHDSNDGLRAALERITRVKLHNLVCETLALAICDPGLRRRHGSECEEDSLPEIYMDSGLSTLRGSHGGYDSEQEGKAQEEEEEEEEEEQRRKDKESADLGYMTSEKAYRIVLAGDAAVGKSSFLLRLCKNEFKLNTSATLGVDFQMKTFIVDGEPVLLQLWDTAGQERFRSIAKSYFRRADGVLLLYDVTCEKSFLNIREWVDMIELMISVFFHQTYNTLFCETSAKDGSNILEAVLHLAR